VDRSLEMKGSGSPDHLVQGQEVQDVPGAPQHLPLQAESHYLNVTDSVHDLIEDVSTSSISYRPIAPKCKQVTN
jgi:hypothetical protein